MRLTASIVAYKNDPKILAQTIQSYLLAAPNSKLYIIDNSPSSELQNLLADPRIDYIHNSKNVGFGAAHNFCIKQILNSSKYHLVLNPDVYFEESVISKVVELMENDDAIGLVLPKVFYPDGRQQFQCKLLPSPTTMFVRWFLRFVPRLVEKINHNYEMRFSGYNTTMNVPFLGGCFMFLRVDVLKKVGLFDERFFLYTEDTDLSRRIHRHYKTIFFPEVSIYHYYSHRQYKNLYFTVLNIFSAIKYFNKWGWLNDKERESMNAMAIAQGSKLFSNA
ncbi:MAG: glycosyltransferase family 2 protein [Pseudomonadota bacterium]